MLNLNTLQIKQTLDNAGINSESTKKRIISIAVGLSVARLVTIPTTPVEGYSDYYNINVKREIDTSIYDVNEQILIDIDLASSIARNYWFIRYKTIYPIMDNGLTVTPEYDLFCKLSCVDLHISLDDYNFCNEHKVVLTNLINVLGKIIK